MAGQVLYIESRCSLTYSNGYLVVERDDVVDKFFIEDIHSIILSTLEISITLYLLNELMKTNKLVVLCDARKFPNSILLPMFGLSSAYRKWQEQVNWNADCCDDIWKQIVQNKIKCQCQILHRHNIDVKCNEPILSGDRSNVEAHFALKYFHRMFGANFHRHHNDHINIALNYGYTLLTSAMSRIIAGHGYNPAVGIHHKGDNNPVNLACDCIEPFRPLVDDVVFEQGDRVLDKQYKQALLSIFNKSVYYQDTRYVVHYAMERYFCDIATALQCKSQIGEVSLF